VNGLLPRGFLPVIHKPTRVSHSSSTFIDHIYYNKVCKNTLSGIILTDVADHFGIFHIIHESSKAIKKQQFTTTRKITEINITRFKQMLNEIDFSEILNTECPNVAYDKFTLTFKDAFNSAFPLSKVRTNKRYMKREPWLIFF